MTRDEILENLCAYDLRNPYGVSPDPDDYREPRGNCHCDNCFYGRDKLAVALLDLMEKADNPDHQTGAPGHD